MNPKKLVKIFHCVFLSGWGGVEKLFQYYSDFNRENPDNSIENIVYSPSPINPEYRIIFETFSGRSFKDVVRLARAIISGEDVVHFHNNYANAKVSSLLKYLPAKSIILEEQGTVWNNSRRFQSIYDASTQAADLIIANSAASKTMLVKKFEVDIKKIRVIHNGVPVPKVLPNVVRRPDTIGYIGRLDSMKGVNVLIKSADFLKKKQIKVEIAGVGPLDSYLKNLAHDLDNVRFVGRVEPYHFISSVAALVVPSIREPFGNILVEAGACSTPIIASRIDGIPEIITHNKTGLLITPSKPVSIPANLSFGTILPEYVVDPVSMDLVSPLELDPLELAESIFSLLGNQEKCLQLTERNFASVSENFSVEKYVLAVRNVYRSFIR